MNLLRCTLAMFIPTFALEPLLRSAVYYCAKHRATPVNFLVGHCCSVSLNKYSKLEKWNIYSLGRKLQESLSKRSTLCNIKCDLQCRNLELIKSSLKLNFLNKHPPNSQPVVRVKLKHQRVLCLSVSGVQVMWKLMESNYVQYTHTVVLVEHWC